MPSDLRRGAGFALAAAAALAVAAACVKTAASSNSNAVIVFARSAVGLAMLLPWALHGGRLALATRRPLGHLWRALFGVVSMVCYFHSIAVLPLAEAVLLTNSMPLYVPFVAWLWLGERPPRSSLPSAVLGLIGVALIVKPGFDGLGAGPALIGAFSGFTAACAMVSIRRIADTEPAPRVVFYFMLVATLLTALPMLWQPGTPSRDSLPALLGVGVFATLGQLFLTRAYAVMAAALVGPFTYTTVVFAGLAGWLVWRERPDALTLLGIGLVVGACLLVLMPGGPAPEPAHLEPD